jgi:pyrimidine-nucleoside phosphorylase
MTPYELIARKKRGQEHTAQELDDLVSGVADGSIPDYQLAAWLMAVWFRGMTSEETFLLTDRMRASGITLDLSSLPGPTADKHSTGGVGDKVSLLLAPLAAELGLYVPMLSGRGLGHTGGTLDKLSAIPGYRVDLTPDELLAQVARVGCAISGQTAEIAPADRRLYHLRDVTASVDCIPLIVSSIMSKKLAAGPRHLVIDLKCGSGAFMRELDVARELARALLATGLRAGRKMAVLVTDMGQPLGQAVGHAVEAREAVEGLLGGGPADLRALTIELVAEMARLAGLGSLESLRQRAGRALDDGSALQRFLRMVEAQGGRLDPRDPLAALQIAPEVAPLVAPADGHVGAMDAESIGLSLVDVGGARVTQDGQLDLGVGLLVPVKTGDRVRQGQTLARLFARSEAAAARCRSRLAAAIPVQPQPIAARPLVLERIA